MVYGSYAGGRLGLDCKTYCESLPAIFTDDHRRVWNAPEGLRAWILHNSADYERFLRSLTSNVGTRKVLYVLEPDAVGLLAKEGGCASGLGYMDNLKRAIAILNENPHAEIYLDIGYWTLDLNGLSKLPRSPR